MQSQLFGRRGWEIQLQKGFCGFVPFTSLYSFCFVRSSSPKKYYKYSYSFRQPADFAIVPQQTILIFDCDPFVKKPREFYYKDLTKFKDGREVPGIKPYLDNRKAIAQWRTFLLKDKNKGRLTFLGNLSVQELRDEIFIDNI
jgi:hypothetical protein